MTTDKPTFKATEKELSEVLVDLGEKPLDKSTLYIEHAERNYQGDNQVWNFKLIQYIYMPSFEVKPHVVCVYTLEKIPYRHQNPDKKEIVSLIRQYLEDSNQVCSCYTFIDKVDAEVFIKNRKQSNKVCR